MRPSYRPAAVALVLAAALSASGCTPDASGKPPASTPSATALFASDEEALAAAEEAYRAYVTTTDQIFAESGEGIERLEAVAVDDQLAEDRTGFEEIFKSGFRSTGQTTFDSIELQQWSGDGHRETEVVVYLCQDISAVDVLDSTGKSVVLATRPDRIRYEVRLASNAESPKLRVSNRSPWKETTC